MELNTDFLVRTFFLVVKAIPVTFKITTVALLLAAIPAFVIAIARIRNVRVLAPLANLFVAVNRGTPMILQILLMYSLIPSLINVAFQKLHITYSIFDVDPIIYAYIVFGISTSATLSEVLRSALQTVAKGQYEAALCAGLNRFQAYWRIVLPQAFVSAVPNLCNLTVGLIKGTSLAFNMTVQDVTAVAKIEASYGLNFIEAYIDIFVVYIIICLTVQGLFKIAEKILNRHKNGQPKRKLQELLNVAFLTRGGKSYA